MLSVNRIIASVAIATFAAISTGHAAEWSRYTDERFGASIEVPATGFTQQSSAAGEEGTSWLSDDGQIDIVFYGAFLIAVDNFTEYRQFEADALKSRHADIIAETKGENWFGFSGTIGDRNFDLRSMRSPDCDTLVANNLYLEYPTSRKAELEGMVKHISESLRSEPGAEC